MPKQLTLHLDNRSDGLSRLLSAVDQHGFTVQRASSRVLDESGRLEVLLEVNSARPVMDLITLLTDLAEVRALQLGCDPVRVTLA